MDVTINGERKTIERERTISEILEWLGVPGAGTAVAVNGRIVPRDEHGTHAISPGDAVDILRPIGGG